MTLGVLFLLFHPPSRTTSQLTLLEKVENMDPLGFILLASSVIMLLLALQWGGQQYAWNSSIIIGLLCGFAGLIIEFAAWQWKLQEEASIPPSTLFHRTVGLACLVGVTGLGGLKTITYWLPVWFQVSLGVSPTASGIDFLPTVVSNVLSSIVSGDVGTLQSYSDRLSQL